MNADALILGLERGLVVDAHSPPARLVHEREPSLPFGSFSMLPFPNVHPVANWTPSPKHMAPWCSPISTMAWRAFAPLRSTPSARIAAKPMRTPMVLAQHLWP